MFKVKNEDNRTASRVSSLLTLSIFRMIYTACRIVQCTIKFVAFFVITTKQILIPWFMTHLNVITKKKNIFVLFLG